MHSPLPLTRDLVLVGGGHTHALVLRAFAMRPVAGLRLTLVDPGPVAAYSGMLPGHVAGHYPRAALEIDLVRLAHVAGARLVIAAADGIDPAAGRLHVTGRAPIGWDLLSVDVGITSAMPGLPGFADHAVPAKPLGPFAAAWQDFVARVGAGQARPRVAVIGAGVAGVELALAMAHRLRAVTPQVTLIEAGRMGAGLGAAARRELRAALDAHGVRLIENTAVTAVAQDTVQLGDGRAVSFDFCTGAAGARPHGWIADSALAVTDGFIDVDDRLRSVSHPAVHAVGDCAHMGFAPRPKAGVFAVRQAPVLAHNLRAALVGGMPRRYHPQRDYLKLISLGRQEALVERSGITLRGAGLWRLKDRIDRNFMDRFRTLRPMEPAQASGDAVRGARGLAAQALCGGCGAKVGATSLDAALSDLPAVTRADILSRPGDDAAVIDMGGTTRQVITTDHLRAVVDDPGLMARIAAMHALGDVWAMGAAPQAALATIILPRMSDPLQTRTLTEITDAAAAVFTAAGAVLAGGHTTLGAELTIGFTVTGRVDRPVTLAGARPGDALVLTRAIGSGTLLAAAMRGRADGRDMAGLYRLMATPQGDAAACLAPLAHAMTDVTGFGLAGHLLALLRAGGCGARIDLAAVPMLDAALRLAAHGNASILAAANRDHVAGALDGMDDGPRARLLVDPQTCGGLLAAIPSDAATRLVAELRAMGHGAALIGTVTEGPPRIALS